MPQNRRLESGSPASNGIGYANTGTLSPGASEKRLSQNQNRTINQPYSDLSNQDCYLGEKSRASATEIQETFNAHPFLTTFTPGTTMDDSDFPGSCNVAVGSPNVGVQNEQRMQNIDQPRCHAVEAPDFLPVAAPSLSNKPLASSLSLNNDAKTSGDSSNAKTHHQSDVMRTSEGVKTEADVATDGWSLFDPLSNTLILPVKIIPSRRTANTHHDGDSNPPAEGVIKTYGQITIYGYHRPDDDPAPEDIAIRSEQTPGPTQLDQPSVCIEQRGNEPTDSPGHDQEEEEDWEVMKFHSFVCPRDEKDGTILPGPVQIVTFELRHRVKPPTVDSLQETRRSERSEQLALRVQEKRKESELKRKLLKRHLARRRQASLAN